jgi:hypothetical protein
MSGHYLYVVIFFTIIVFLPLALPGFAADVLLFGRSAPTTYGGGLFVNIFTSLAAIAIIPVKFITAIA